jgi:hypothetical protein
MPDFNGRKAVLFIPYWEAKCCFYELEYAEMRKRPVLGDRDFWDPDSREMR